MNVVRLNMRTRFQLFLVSMTLFWLTCVAIVLLYNLVPGARWLAFLGAVIVWPLQITFFLLEVMDVFNK